MPLSQPLDGFLLEAIMSDADQFDTIVAYLNEPDSEWSFRFERPVQRAEVLVALQRVVKDGLVEVHLLDEEANDFVDCGERVWPGQPIGAMYFDLTGRGRVRYLNLDL